MVHYKERRMFIVFWTVITGVFFYPACMEAQENTNTEPATIEEAYENTNTEPATIEEAYENTNTEPSTTEEAQEDTSTQLSTTEEAQEDTNTELSTTEEAQENTNMGPSTTEEAQEDTSTQPSTIEEQVFEQIGPLTLLDLAPLTREEIIQRLKEDLNIHVKSTDTSLFDRYLLSYIYNYFQTMRPSGLDLHSYNLHSLGESSHRLVARVDENNLYFSTNAGSHTITKNFKEVMDAVFGQTFTVLPYEVRMTFEYNNELYAQLNEAVLSSEDIKDFMKRQSGILFPEDLENTTSFTREELLMILKQYLDLPVHIRNNLALKRIIRVEHAFSLSSFFSVTLGRYNPNSETITLADAAFEEQNTDNRGEGTFLHEIGHALWAKSVWEGLSNEAKEAYARLSWYGDERINDEFVTEYSATNIQEDFAEHFSAYINYSSQLKHATESKYNWLREHIFLNVEYVTDVADHLKVFVESEHGDTTPPYFINHPYESIKLTISVDESQEDYWRNGDANIRVEVSGLFDDLSEIKSIEILMQSRYDYFWIKPPQNFKLCSSVVDNKTHKDCVYIDPNNPGGYVFHSFIRLALSYPGDYKIVQVKLEDKAGNKRILRSRLGDTAIHFPGTKDRMEKEEAQKQLAQEEAERHKAAGEMEGYNILNLSGHPVKMNLGEKDLFLQVGECISIVEQDLWQLHLETVSGWLDGELDTVICSNTTDSADVPRCWVDEASIIKKNDENGEYVLTKYNHEKEADFRECRASKAKREKDKEEELKKTLEEMTGFNIVNLSNQSIRVYQNLEKVLDLKPNKCIKLTQKELLNITLKTNSGRDNFICTNIENSLNIDKCNVTVISLLQHAANGEYILTDYQGEESLDFSQCNSLPKVAEDILENDKKDEDLSESAGEERERLPMDAEKKQDQDPPYFTNPPRESVSVSVVRSTDRYTIIKVEVNGLFDDASEVELIEVFMRSENDYFSIKSSPYLCDLKSNSINDYDTQCLYMNSDHPGRYIYYAQESRSQNYPGDYSITTVRLQDNLKNAQDIQDFDNPLEQNTFFFPGTRLLINENTIREDLEIKTSKTADRDTLVRIFTTDMTIFDRDVDVHIINTESGKDLKYSIDINQLASLNAHFNSPAVLGKMSLPIVIPKEFPSGRYRLKWLAFEDGDNYGRYYVQFNRSNPNVYFDHISDEEDSIAQPVVDDIVMEVVDQANSRGGNKSIKISIPIEDLDQATGEVDIIVRTPTGGYMSVSTRYLFDPYQGKYKIFARSPDEGHTVVLESSHPDEGSQNMSVWLHLGPRHAEGEYRLTHISTMEDYSRVVDKHRGLRLLEGKQRRYEARLRERQIRLTLTISPPRFPTETVIENNIL